MQQIWKQAYHKALLLNTFSNSRRFAPVVMRQSQTLMNAQSRSFADTLQVNQQEQQAIDLNDKNKRLGVDMSFDEKKHAYVLSFPWNFQEIISDFESHKALTPSSYWYKFIQANAINEFNALFREFHQVCAVPNYLNMDKICEGNMAHYLKESVKRIHFHGLDIEMANLTVEQPRIRTLKVEVHHGVNVQRSKNLPASQYNISKSSLLGAAQTVYIPKNDTRSFLDHLDNDYKPYLIAATVLIESPMKLFVQNQNFSSVLFGSTDDELVKNVVRFETNLRWNDLFKILSVPNKASFDWKITDFNNVLNENPLVQKF